MEDGASRHPFLVAREPGVQAASAVLPGPRSVTQPSRIFTATGRRSKPWRRTGGLVLRTQETRRGGGGGGERRGRRSPWGSGRLGPGQVIVSLWP